MSESLLTPEAAKWAGMVTEIPCAPITKADVLRFLVGSDNVTARDASQPLDLPDDAPVPPMIYQALYRRPVPATELTVDGVTADRRPPVGEGRGMNGEVELEFKRPLRIGDRLHGRRTLVSLEEKAGRRRRVVVATYHTVFTDAGGDEVIIETVRQILF